MRRAAALLAFATLAVATTQPDVKWSRAENGRAFGIIADVEEFAKYDYDYLIVGGGSAGLVLANRLSANPLYTVGVIEAGQWYPNEDLINVPGTFGQARNNASFDWLIKTTPQPGVFNRQIEQPRGKLLGGSSGLTYHNYARGSIDEYDAWEELGNPGWNWNSLWPYFTKTDDVTPGPVGFLPGVTQPPGLANAQGGAVGGPIKVGYSGNNTFITPYIAEFHQSFRNRGGYLNADPEGGNSTGVTLTARSIDPRTSVRSYSTNGYLLPVLDRQNLLVLTTAHATKLNFDPNTIGGNGTLLKATGVEYGQPETTQRFNVSANREVILSAGSLKSPQLLELSGIGNQTLLSSLGIPTILDLPEVGENLQDHLEFNSDFLLREDAPWETWDIYRNIPGADELAWQEYRTNGTGVYNSSPATLVFYPLQTFPEAFNVTELVEELDRELAVADLTPIRKKHLAINRRHLLEGKVTQVEVSMVPRGGVAASPYPPLPGRSYLTLVSFILRPYSAGNVHINTTDPFAAPLVDPRYNDFSFDWKVGAQWTAFLRKIMTETEPMSKYIEAPIQPSVNTTTLKAWDDFCRNYTISVWHPVGSTSMASRELGGVVDPNMVVYGTQNLRVIDAGSLPINIATHTISTIYAMAEKMADVIMANRRLQDSVFQPVRTLEDLEAEFGYSPRPAE